MAQFWLPVMAVVLGFAGLIWSADRFVAGSAALAHNLGISKMVIGLTIVAFGTSAPEVVVSISASMRQAGELAVGNALGSNLANMGLVLGITALIAPLPFYRHLLVREVPALLLVTALAGVFLLDSQLHAWEGWILLVLLPAVMLLLIMGKRPSPESFDAEIPQLGHLASALWFLVGLVTLIASSEVLVWGAEQLALGLGIAPLVVGLTVIAIGTSLPELAASVMSALKGHQDIALGNIIGSNLFNILAVMAIPALIQQPAMDTLVFYRDFMAMGLMTTLLALVLWVSYGLPRKKGASAPGEPAPPRDRQGQLGKSIGALLLLTYGGYFVWLFVTL